ncbi:hypothetical protein L249_3339 [Ophiocordyceps polyrhachis-furcata BCC 54312]|uniref:Reverse transcriptase RNase H-like domain-containing protein n=1 Tax=Ophiocordyceps polyrhachis-furcata BCC 54312 TaxID=1330021 RepID=A0A367LQ99_9HYPO|nr:hypothetical protein L249_3339 [Ophiocordyceps polyrhachis-furcata BCC 54312]
MASPSQVTDYPRLTDTPPSEFSTTMPRFQLTSDIPRTIRHYSDAHLLCSCGKRKAAQSRFFEDICPRRQTAPPPPPPEDTSLRAGQEILRPAADRPPPRQRRRKRRRNAGPGPDSSSGTGTDTATTNPTNPPPAPASPAEANYDATKRECKAVLCAMRRLRLHIYGVHFFLETDARVLRKKEKDPTYDH